MKKLIIPFIFTVLFFICCNKNTDSDQVDLERIVVDIKQLEYETDGTFLVDTTSFEVVALETNPKCLIGEIAKVHLRRDKIIVYDELTKSAFIFNRDGSYYSRVHALGNGPGEYPPVVNDMVIMDRHVGVLIPVLNKIMLYNFEGEYERDISLHGTWGYTFFSFDNEKYYIVNNGSRSQKGCYRLFQFDINKGKVKGFLPFEADNSGWGLKNYYSLYDNKALIIYSTIDTIFEVKPDEDIAPRYFVDIVHNKLPQRLVRGDGHTALEVSIRENLLTGVDKIMETKKYIILNISNDFGVVYDKRDKKVVATSEIFSLDGVGGFPIYLLSEQGTLENDVLINTVSSEIALYVYKDAFNENTLKNKHFAKKYTEAVSKLKDGDDNPILIIYKTN